MTLVCHRWTFCSLSFPVKNVVLKSVDFNTFSPFAVSKTAFPAFRSSVMIIDFSFLVFVWDFFQCEKIMRKNYDTLLVRLAGKYSFAFGNFFSRSLVIYFTRKSKDKKKILQLSKVSLYNVLSYSWGHSFWNIHSVA